MKRKNIRKLRSARIWFVAAAMALVLALGAAGFAESLTGESEVYDPALEDEFDVFDEGFGTLEESAETPAEDQTAASADDSAYEDAYNAYCSARRTERMTEFKDEIEKMVTEGSLTREQAELLIERAEAQAALASGTCPNCGKSLPQTGRGMGKGGKSGRGMGGMGRW